MKKRILPFLTLILLTSMSFAQTHTIQVTVPDSIQACFVTGGFNGWTEPGANEQMTRISDTDFTYEFEAADTAGIEYKIYTGPSWQYEQVQAATFRFSTDSIVQVDEFKAYYDTTFAKEVTIDVLVPGEVVVLYLTGNFCYWSTGINEMEEVDSTANGKEFQLTVFVLDTTKMEFKFIAGPEWGYQQTDPDNFKLADGNVVVCNAFDAIYNPNALGDITLNITVPEGTAQVWIIGSFGQWLKENAIQATKNQDNTFTAIIPNVGAITYKCYSYPDWTYEEAKDAEGNSLDADRSATIGPGPEYDITLDITVDFWKLLYVPTGVKDYEAPENLIYTRNKSIIVEGVVEKVSVIDVQGRMVQDARIKGTFTSKSLGTGVYIIRVDGKTKKVLVQ